MPVENPYGERERPLFMRGSPLCTECNATREDSTNWQFIDPKRPLPLDGRMPDVAAFGRSNGDTEMRDSTDPAFPEETTGACDI